MKTFLIFQITLMNAIGIRLKRVFKDTDRQNSKGAKRRKQS